MMKCENFEFEYVAAPDEIAGDACEHLKTCSRCQSFVEQEKLFQDKLTAVINCEVPEGFRHSVRSHVVNSNTSFWSMPRATMALAASMLLAVGLVTLNKNQFNTQDIPLDRLIVEHLEYDGASSILASNEMESSQLQTISQQFGVSVKQSSHVSFAEKCPIGDSYGLHMVYQYQGKPITVIYMPEISPKEAIMINYSGVKGWVKPLQKGSMAVLTSTTNELPSVEQADQSIEWL
jgi:hypothetical protein